MNKFLSKLRMSWFFLIYLFVVIYTLIFPTTASWFMFYSFTLWLSLSFLLTRPSCDAIKVDWVHETGNTLTFSFVIRNKRHLPFFLSSVQIQLLIEESQQTVHTSAVFTRTIEGQLPSITLPRGHHDTITLGIKTMGLFGIWKNQTTQTIAIDVDIYPGLLPKTERTKLLKRLTPLLIQTSHSSTHDYNMIDIRSFQNRDSLAGIDWKSSLKRGQWLVKEYEYEEEAPLALYFLGFDTSSFEALLSLGYSLAKELSNHQKVTVFLLGQFDHRTAISQKVEDVLYIEPAVNQGELSHLLQTSFNRHSKKIIIKSRHINTPLPSYTEAKDIILDEEAFLFLKGGE